MLCESDRTDFDVGKEQHQRCQAGQKNETETGIKKSTDEAADTPALESCVAVTGHGTRAVTLFPSMSVMP